MCYTNTVKTITLTQHQVTYVDDDDYAFLNQWKWCAHKDRHTFYAKRWKGIKMHHLIVGKPLKGFEVDHIDGNGLNNQRSNLRIVTQQANSQNTHKHRAGRLVGCYFMKPRAHLLTPWMSYITVNHKRIYLGVFGTEQEAHDAYLRALTD